MIFMYYITCCVVAHTYFLTISNIDDLFHLLSLSSLLAHGNVTVSTALSLNLNGVWCMRVKYIAWKTAKVHYVNYSFLYIANKMYDGVEWSHALFFWVIHILIKFKLRWVNSKHIWPLRFVVVWQYNQYISS